MHAYAEFLETKRLICSPVGFAVNGRLSPALFPFQRDIVRWALRLGRAAIFADCGMGKTLMQLEWARHVTKQTQGHVLILAPLAVASQTQREGEKFGIAVTVAKSHDEVKGPITVTNYERMDRFDLSAFVGVVLDESSILKSYDGAMRTQIIEAFAKTPFRLACTATPAPNDYMELGNHSQFLGVLSRSEMLATFFVHDGGETQTWRLKGHAQQKFWDWVCSWAVMVSKPSDLLDSDERFILPPLRWHHERIESHAVPDGLLFALEAQTLQERIRARSATVEERAQRCTDLIKTKGGTWIVWCNLNKEAEAICRILPEAVEVRGTDPAEMKEARLMEFVNGTVRVLVSKSSICGFGMNFQHCHQVAYLGLSDSYESLYQSIRRCWRFGQQHPVDAYVVTADIEGEVVRNIQRKETNAARMRKEMMSRMREMMREAVQAKTTDRYVAYERETKSGEGWVMELGDSVELLKALKAESVDYTIFSPPFSSLYTYSASERDMGNCRSQEEFLAHFRFLVSDLLRVTKPGRLLSFHCMNLPTSKAHFGYIGLRDFRGDLIRLFQEAGWIYHSEVCIWKDPVTAMQRTKALGLLHKQLKKDSCLSRQGIPDYVVTMRKPGENPQRVSHTNKSFPVSKWQAWASPIWMDINPSDTLQFRSAREDKDERHICPLQLEVIRRALILWSNPRDFVLSPFAGIGSEGYVAIELGRRFLGMELKRSYYEQAYRNLQAAEQKACELFSGAQ